MADTQNQDAQEKRPAPPFPNQPQSIPGLESKMDPAPDYGEATYQGMGKLTGKRALITGGDSGIGRAVALAFAREGADVAISYLPEEEEDAQKTASLIQQAGRRALQLPGDISDEQHCLDIVQQTVNSFGGVDILVNNAAFQTVREDIQEFSTEEFERAFRVNVFAMFFLCKAAIPHMQEGSAIINVASIQAYEPSDTLLPYSSTKGAIVTFSKALSKQCLKKGIRVNVVAPGPVWTPLIVATMPEERATSFGKQSPMERPAQPAELAPIFVLLASQDGSFINGEVVGVTGGKFIA